MRVLLFQSPLGRKGVADQLVFPIGLCCVATALEDAGHEPRVVDLNVGDEDTDRAVERAVADFRPDAVGVSQRNIDSTTRKAPFVYHTSLEPLLRSIRRVAPDVPTILGGPGFTQASQTFMERYGYDFGVQAEAEQTLPALLERLDAPQEVPGVYWRDGQGGVRYGGDREMPDFSALSFPRRHYVDWEVYREEERRRGLMLDVGIESTRGCPRRCAYCNYPYLNGKRLRRKPPEVVADEVAYLAEQFDVRQFTFTDSRFNEDPAHARDICQAMLRRGLQARWVAWLGFEGLDVELLELMRAAGCHRVAFSPDGLLQPSLDRMRKDTTTAQIAESVRTLRRVKGIKASWSFFATPPSTSRREQLAMLAWYAWIHGSLKGRGRMTLTWCRVEEDTHFETIAREDGVVPAGVDLLPDDPADLDPLFYIPPGFERWSRFWDRFLDSEMKARAAAGRLTRPLRRFGFRDLTPGHMRGS